MTKYDSNTSDDDSDDNDDYPGGGEVHSIQKVILPEYRSVHHFQAHRHLPFHPATQTHGHTLHQRKTVDVISND